MDNKIGLHKITHPFIFDFYKIQYSANLSGKLKYGRHFYDFDEGGLFLISPNQVIVPYDNNGRHTGYTLFIHPNFSLTCPLARKMKQYGFFSYSASEVLHLSGTEKATIVSILKMIEQELKLPIDDFTRDVVISQFEPLLNYGNRFYKRPFIARKAANSNMLQKLEEILDDYFNNEISLTQGIPTIQYFSEYVNISPGYLSDMLRYPTRQNTQQCIHAKLIEKAEEK